MMKYKHIAWMTLLIWGVGSLAPTISAQKAPIVWQQTEGPYGGSFSALAADPYTGHVWARASGKVYVSQDGSNTWLLRSLPRPASTFAFRSDGAIFASRYRSDDQGTSWTEMGLPDSVYVRDFAFDEATGHIIVATGDGIFHSTDDGVQWTRREATNVKRVWATGAGYFFAQTRENNTQLLRSTDGGISWHINPVPNNEITLGFIPGPDDQAYLLALDVEDYRNVAKFYRTTDQGETWELLRRFSCFATDLLGFTPDGALIMSHDGGVVRVSSNFRQCETVFDDVERTYPSGRHSYSSLRAVTLDNQGRLFVYTGFGEFWRSTDSGQSWEQIQPHGIIGTSVYALYRDARTGSLWAGAGRKGLFRSEDQGMNWAFQGFAAQSIARITAGGHPGELWVATHLYGLFHTQDDGVTWTFVDTGIPGWLWDVRYEPNTQTLFVLSPVYDIYYSQDQGQSWHPMNAPYASNIDAPIVGMTLSPEGSIYAMIRDDILAGTHGVYRTSDRGQTWEKIDQSFPRYPYGWTIFLFDMTGRLWAGDGRDVYYSSDQGITWTHATSTSGWINTVLETPDGSLWIGHDEGLLRSIDGGQTWHEEHEALDNPCVLALVWDEQNHQVWVGTHGGGVYRGSLEGLNTDSEDEPLVPVQEVGLGNYPNPAGQTTTITFDLQQAAPVRLALYDPLGRKIIDLLNQHLPPGSHQFTVDMSRLSPGLYFYRLETPFGVFTNPTVHIE